MNPRPPKGTPPKGPSPLISFRITTESQKLISEIRSLEPHAEPGLIPPSVGSDSEFARWLFLDSMNKLHNRLVAQLRLKDLIIKDKTLHERQDYILRLAEKGNINKQGQIDAMDELQEEIDNNYQEIEKTCIENLIPPPAGYEWDEVGNPFEYHPPHKSEISELQMTAWDFGNYLMNPESRDVMTTKRRTRILNFATQNGWSLDTVEQEKQILLDLLDGTHPVAKLISPFGMHHENGHKTFTGSIKMRLRDIESK